MAQPLGLFGLAGSQHLTVLVSVRDRTCGSDPLLVQEKVDKYLSEMAIDFKARFPKTVVLLKEVSRSQPSPQR